MKKLLLTAIFKDDSEYNDVKRMLESFMPHFHGLAVAITGLSGKHKKLDKLIKKYKGEIVYTTPTSNPEIYSRGKDNKWFFSNFAAAREVSFELASKMQEEGKYDWWSWADADDILYAGEELQEAAENGDKLNLDSIFFNYWYSVVRDKKGNVADVAIEHLRERLLKPDRFKWISRLHEVTVPKDENYKPRNSLWESDDEKERKCVWIHLPEDDRVVANLYRNIDILNKQKEEELAVGKDDPRTTFYLAKTYIDLCTQENNTKYLDKAEEKFLAYLEKSGWPEERSDARQYLGSIYVQRNKPKEALEHYHAALREYPVKHLVYLMIADQYFKLEQYEQFRHWMEVAKKLDAPSSRTTIGNPLQVKVTAATLEYNDALRQTDLDKAIYWLGVRNKLLRIDSDKDDMMKILNESRQMNEAAKGFFNYAKWLKDTKQTKYIPGLLDAATPEMRKEQFMQVISNQFQNPKKWGNRSIAYFIGPTFEPWDDLSMTKGLGGSETAATMLSQEWAKNGWDVTVFCDTENEGTRKGVHWRHWSTFNWNDSFNVLIVWRNPATVDVPQNAKLLCYDAHDVESQLNWPDERIQKIDKIFVKSEFHRKMLPKVPDEKIQVISNGIL